MSSDRQQSRVQLDAYDVGADERAGAPPNPTPSTPFCIALVGDFSGRSNRGLLEVGRALAQRRPIRVDRDNLDEAIARLEPTLRVPLGVDEVEVRFSEIDHFHPDSLFRRLSRFRALADARDRASAPEPGRERRQAPTRAEPGGRAASGSLLDQILGDVPAPPGGGAAMPPRAESPSLVASDPVTEFARRVAAPHVVADTSPARPDLVVEVEREIAAEMRALLHHPDFKAVESAWRSADFLVRRLETDESLRIYIVDVSREELAADLGSRDPATSGLHRLFVDSSVGTLGAAPWSLLVGLFEFGEEEADVRLLLELGELAKAAGAPFVAAARSSLFGCESFGATPDPDDWTEVDSRLWDALRREPEARYLAMAAPRFLVRLPYGGPDGEPSEAVRFEEVASRGDHDDYLWTPSSVLVALLYGEAFATDGWALRPGLDVRGLPLHLVRDNGEVAATPCAEAVLTARAIDRIADRGVMAVQSYKDGDAVRFVRLQSISAPLARIAVRQTDADDRAG